MGDLAIVVKAPALPGMLGALVTILRAARFPTERVGDDWVIATSAGKELGAPDHCLRPIRDNDGIDETLVTRTREMT